MNGQIYPEVEEKYKLENSHKPKKDKWIDYPKYLPTKNEDWYFVKYIPPNAGIIKDLCLYSNNKFLQIIASSIAPRYDITKLVIHFQPLEKNNE